MPRRTMKNLLPVQSNGGYELAALYIEGMEYSLAAAPCAQKPHEMVQCFGRRDKCEHAEGGVLNTSECERLRCGGHFEGTCRPL